MEGQSASALSANCCPSKAVHDTLPNQQPTSEWKYLLVWRSGWALVCLGRPILTQSGLQYSYSDASSIWQHAAQLFEEARHKIEGIHERCLIAAGGLQHD